MYRWTISAKSKNGQILIPEILTQVTSASNQSAFEGIYVRFADDDDDLLWNDNLSDIAVTTIKRYNNAGIVCENCEITVKSIEVKMGGIYNIEGYFRFNR